ncbi:MAG: 50S ribosomal protein L29 [Planctomycetes bacterium]|nr:50S ribosomal protein L29 [Planctomycetota bacterium]
MKANDIREMNPDELSDELENLQKKFFEIRTQAVTEKLEDPTQLTKVKRDIARIMTVIRERQIVEQAQAGGTEQP